MRHHSLATLRVLLVLAQALGLTVAVGDCAQAFLQAPILEKSDVWVTPPPGSGSATWTSLAATQDPARPEGRTCRLEPPRNQSQGRALMD